MSGTVPAEAADVVIGAVADDEMSESKSVGDVSEVLDGEYDVDTPVENTAEVVTAPDGHGLEVPATGSLKLGPGVAETRTPVPADQVTLAPASVDMVGDACD